MCDGMWWMHRIKPGVASLFRDLDGNITSHQHQRETKPFAVRYNVIIFSFGKVRARMLQAVLSGSESHHRSQARSILRSALHTVAREFYQLGQTAGVAVTSVFFAAFSQPGRKEPDTSCYTRAGTQIAVLEKQPCFVSSCRGSVDLLSFPPININAALRWPWTCTRLGSFFTFTRSQVSRTSSTCSPIRCMGYVFVFFLPCRAYIPRWCGVEPLPRGPSQQLTYNVSAGPFVCVELLGMQCFGCPRNMHR